MKTFSEAKYNFDTGPGRNNEISLSLVPVDGKIKRNISIRNLKGEPLEEFYKWQFIYALINSGLYAKDYIGAEIRFPKGNKTSAPIRLDGAIFDDQEWLQHYNDYWQQLRPQDLEWLNDHLIAIIEFKGGDKEIEKVFSGQIKPAMKEKDPSTAYVLGIYYDRERLFLYHRRDGLFLRYDEAKNQKGKESKVGDLSLHLPDPYIYIPSYEDLLNRVHRPSQIDRSKRSYNELDVITSIATVQLQNALSEVLRTLDKAGLVNQRGYQILIETFALKIFDEKRNDNYPKKKLEFYITEVEASFHTLSDKPVQDFINRMKGIRAEAAGQYQKILSADAIDWRNTNHVKAVVAVCHAFQDFSFIKSANSDLYQLVFYNFANAFKREESAQFLTPLPVIDFLVKIVNPRNGETIIDPCCGIADFLSLSYVNASRKDKAWQLDDANIYGVDLDENMIMLATLNMLLNGDGEAKLHFKHNPGSILAKFANGNPPVLVDLIPERHQKGSWNNWPDNTRLMQFDVVLTNPPFGEDRAYRPRNDQERRIIEIYETWHLMRQQVDKEDSFEAKHIRGKTVKQKNKGVEAIDLGIVFLENAYHILKPEGRFGIVLSNSIASINRWEQIRRWLMERMRIVALFDLPANVFAETGVNTTLIVAYKPKNSLALKKLIESDYSVFVRDINQVGYEKRTSKRNVFFNPLYKIDETTFKVITDKEGYPILEEDFTQTIIDFRQWAMGQEEILQRLFCKEY